MGKLKLKKKSKDLPKGEESGVIAVLKADTYLRLGML